MNSTEIFRMFKGNNDFCNNIKSLRKNRSMTLVKMSELIGCSKSYLWLLENKKDASPSAKTVMNIASAFSVTVEYLFGIESNIENAEDEKFYSEYRKMGEETKLKIRSCAKLFM